MTRRKSTSRAKTLSLAEIRSEIDEISTEARELIEDAKTEQRDLDDDEDERIGEISERLEELRDLETKAVDKQAHLRSLIDNGAIEAGTPQAQHKPVTERDKAMRTLERGVKAKELPAEAAEKVEAMLSSRDDSSLTARWAVTTGSPEYRSAFGKLANDPERGHLDFTGDEAQAFRDVREVSRAMSIGSGSAGGYMVPLSLDPAILLTSNGSVNPLRKIARVAQINTSAWQGVSSAGVTAEWTPELQQVSEVTPVLDDPRVPVHKGDAYTTFSFELEDDGLRFLDEPSKVLVDAADQLQAQAYITGTGVNQPTGLITALVAAGGSVIVSGSGTEALSSADAYALQGALGSRFSPNAQFAGHLLTQNAFRQMETGNGALKFPELAGNPPRLLGRPFNEISGMDGSLNAAATESNYPLVYGDFQNFLIVDRVGTRIEFVQNVMGANNRPIGARGALLWFRTGSDVINPNAFRLLRVNTTA
ncbi:phage major capsid protein [Rhodococcoides fascians]|uniref:phage major capsid protein n=1 Tax=Rhodococcoides fascians TaxID=1828 RepID=UPI0006903543|nr:phage major capsid protein [Rhodococcus fascians]